MIITMASLVNFNCNPADEDTRQIAFEILETDTGKTFQAKINDEFTIALPECVGCAEVWTITKQDSNRISLEERTSRDRSCTGCVGGSLTRVFRFRCMQAGTSKLELGYFEDTLRVTIEIQ